MGFQLHKIINTIENVGSVNFSGRDPYRLPHRRQARDVGRTEAGRVAPQRTGRAARKSARRQAPQIEDRQPSAILGDSPHDGEGSDSGTAPCHHPRMFAATKGVQTVSCWDTLDLDRRSRWAVRGKFGCHVAWHGYCVMTG